MKYIKSQDYEYIKNKYHDTKKPFDTQMRFVRHDKIFSPDSGMAPEDIIEGIADNDSIYANLSHPVRKARALEYVLKNTRISCGDRDIFPAINMIDRPLSKTIIKNGVRRYLPRPFRTLMRAEDNLSATASLRSGPITIIAFLYGIGYSSSDLSES